MKIIITINYLSGTISKAFMIPSYMHIVVIEEDNSYIISVVDREDNIKEILFEIEKDEVDKKKAFEIERYGGDRISNWINYINGTTVDIHKERSDFMEFIDETAYLSSMIDNLDHFIEYLDACCERSKEQDIASQKLKEAVFWLTYASDIKGDETYEQE